MNGLGKRVMQQNGIELYFSGGLMNIFNAKIKIQKSESKATV